MIKYIMTGGVVPIQGEMTKRCDYLYHTLRPATAEELSSDIMREYEYKQKGNKDVKKRLPTYVDMNADKVLILELYVAYNPRLLKVAYIPSCVSNTKDELLRLANMGYKFDGPIIDTILSSDFHKHYDKNDENFSKSLIQTFRFYVPKNDSGYYLLSGNRYFNCYFKKDKYAYTRDGKMKVSIRDTTLSYFYEADGELIHEVIGKKYNPFIYQVDGDDFDLEIFEEILTKPDMDILRKTYESYQKMVTSGVEIEKPWDNILAEIDQDFITDTILSYFSSRGDKAVDEDANKFSRYESLLNGGSKNLAMELRRRLVTPNKKGGHLPVDLLKKLPHPCSLTTQIKSNKQFPMWNKTNEHDGFFSFTYITKTNELMITESQREFKEEDMYIVDPISTSGTKNVGVSGEMCSSLSNSYIED
jgi:hypothetical protein